LADDDGDRLATLEVGLMRNRTAGRALGASLLFGVGDQITENTGILIGIKPRLRTWLGRTMSVDMSPGLLYVAYGNANSGTLALTAHAAVNVGDWGAMTGQTLVPLSRGSGSPGWYVGGRLGSYAGVISAIVAPLAVLVSFLIDPPE
jgi:hypothetical protein